MLRRVEQLQGAPSLFPGSPGAVERFFPAALFQAPVMSVKDSQRGGRFVHRVARGNVTEGPGLLFPHNLRGIVLVAASLMVKP